MTKIKHTLDRRTFLAGLAATATAGTSSQVFAQSFPSKPVELVVLFPSGSSADVTARVLADSLGKHLGQPVIVVNKPGAGGAIGYKYVQQQKPDGHTLVLNSNSISTVHHSGLTPFDYRAFDAIARVTVENPVIAVKADAPWKDLKSLVTDARKRPGAVSMGNSGIGSHTHITSVAFFQDQQVEVLHVPFGSAQAVTSLLGGHVDALVQLPGALTPQVRSGSLRILGVLSSAREPTYPTVATATEQGLPFSADMWRGIAAPKGTPSAVVTRLEEALQKAVASPEFKSQGEKLGFLPSFLSARDFAPLIAKEDLVLARLMHRVGLKLQ
ncbi:MAG: tripartite tricarboxylate transporter substrate binding protein [Rhodoferax sp.]|nr:tripartite tricarboxylate transporter substrate binding protein [Rhodoferax sp.]MCF8207971.1 tripartite tricarboxylate transporter substrate binding protein [Rhodoferax sp.]